MRLIPGVRLGPYEIQASIGAGGMGEVYKALDTELHRMVALKVLPDQFIRDAERVSRFEREATTLASMNHPHVAQVYGIARDADENRVLVMEYVEGEDLSALIRRGLLPVDDALPIARQIASALEAAHEAGIVHRDLKPANIKVQSDGTVKVLDFGLARHVPVADVSPSPSDLATITSPALTERGVILGTAAYMSPEQAKGRVVDRRTDIWSLGCVMFEMLSGQRVFSGETVAETMTSVLRDSPDWSLLPDSTPDSIRKLLRRCLERERAERLDSAAAVRLDIDDALAGGTAELAIGSSPRSRGRLAWTFAAAAALVAAGLLATMAWLLRVSADTPELRLDISTPATADPYSFALSPDGQGIVFVAGGSNGQLHLWLRMLTTANAVPLPTTEGAVYPFWSPGARSIGFFANGKLKRIDLAGGGAVTLADAPAGRGGSWSTGDQILFTQNASGPISVVSSTGSDARTVTALSAGDSAHLAPSWHPDGRRFVFFLESGDSEQRGLYLAHVDRPGRSRLVPADGSAQFQGPARILYVRESTLYGQGFEDAGNLLTGSLTAVASPVPSSLGRSAFSISDSGRIAYRTGRTIERQLRWFMRNGESAEAFSEPDAERMQGPSLSPSGQRVAIQRSFRGNTDLWIVDGTAGAANRLTADPAPDLFPVWSPDESTIAFRSTRDSTPGIYTARTDAEGGESRLLSAATVNAALISPTSWSPDGRWLLFYSLPASASRDVWVLPIGRADNRPRRLIATAADESNARFSPDGRWILYQTNETGRFEIAVRAFPSGERVWQVSSNGGVQGRWSRDGTELYYIAPGGRLMAVPVSATGSAFRAGPPVALFAARFAQSAAANPFVAEYDVAADGRFLINMTLDEVAAAPITLILNWNGGQP